MARSRLEGAGVTLGGSSGLTQELLLQVSPRLRLQCSPALAVSLSIYLSGLHFWATGKMEMLRADTQGQRQVFGMETSLGGACRTSRWLIHRCTPALLQP